MRIDPFDPTNPAERSRRLRKTLEEIHEGERRIAERTVRERHSASKPKHNLIVFTVLSWTAIGCAIGTAYVPDGGIPHTLFLWGASIFCFLSIAWFHLWVTKWQD